MVLINGFLKIQAYCMDGENAFSDLDLIYILAVLFGSQLKVEYSRVLTKKFKQSIGSIG